MNTEIILYICHPSYIIPSLFIINLLSFQYNLWLRHRNSYGDFSIRIVYGDTCCDTVASNSEAWTFWKNLFLIFPTYFFFCFPSTGTAMANVNLYLITVMLSFWLQLTWLLNVVMILCSYSVLSSHSQISYLIGGVQIFLNFTVFEMLW